jgi:hypothetical protein
MPRQQRAGREHMAHDMHPPAHVPVGVGCRLLSLARQAGVGKEDVHRPEPRLGRCDQRLNIALLADISGDGKAIDVAGDASKPLARRFQVGHHHAARAGLRISARHRLADTACRSRDDADFIFDIHDADPVSGLTGLPD